MDLILALFFSLLAAVLAGAAAIIVLFVIGAFLRLGLDLGILVTYIGTIVTAVAVFVLTFRKLAGK